MQSSGLYHTTTITTQISVPLSLDEIRGKAEQSTKAYTCVRTASAYRGIMKMAQNANAKEIEAVVLGALDSGSNLKNRCFN